MRPHIAESVPEAVWVLLDEIRAVVQALPETLEVPAFILGVRISSDRATGTTIPNCHIIARALATILPVQVHDGVVTVGVVEGKSRICNHSWLTVEGQSPSFIIDPWPLGSVGGPTLFIQDYAYHFGPECSFLEHRSEEFTCHLEATIAAVRLAAEQLWPTRFIKSA